MTKIILLDPGHGGVNPGAVAHDGRMEKDGVLDIAYRVKQILVAESSHTVYMTRSDDSTRTLTSRSDMANRLNADVFVSIHMNSCAATRHHPKGLEVYGWGAKSLLAVDVHDAMMRVLDPKPVDRGVRDGSRYSTVRRTRCPSIVVECGFINNREEVELLWDNTYRQLLARGIANGILEFLQ